MAWFLEMEDEDKRSIEDLQQEIVWDDEGLAHLLDEDDSEYLDRKHGREH